MVPPVRIGFLWFMNHVGDVSVQKFGGLGRGRYWRVGATILSFVNPRN